MIPRSILLEHQVVKIKELLWEGILRQVEIGDTYNVTQPTISQIFRGYQWPEIQWPNGETGEIPHERWLEIIRSKRRHAIYSRGDRREPSKEAVEAARIMRDATELETEISDSRFGAAVAQKAPESSNKRVRRQLSRPESQTWRLIKKRDPGHKLVQRAERTNDQALKDIITNVFSVTSFEQWHNRGTVKAILDLENRK